MYLNLCRQQFLLALLVWEWKLCLLLAWLCEMPQQIWIIGQHEYEPDDLEEEDEEEEEEDWEDDDKQLIKLFANAHLDEKKRYKIYQTYFEAELQEYSDIYNAETLKKLDNIIKSSETNVASAWSNYQSSKGILRSIRAQVNAAEIANEGITVEYQRGSRSTLDFIQSTSILLDARVSLANSEKEFILAQYNLLKSIGLLNSNYLNIK